MPEDIACSTDRAELIGPSFACYNIRSITKKIDDLRLLLGRSQLNCLGLTETWLNASISDEELLMDNYRLFRADRDNGSYKRGGVDLRFIVIASIILLLWKSGPSVVKT